MTLPGRRETRIRIDERGVLEIVDPTFDDIALLRELDPSFDVPVAELPGFAEPRVVELRRRGAGVSHQELAARTDEYLWDRHESATSILKSGVLKDVDDADEASLLDLKVELAQRMLADCRLCGLRCGVDRRTGRLGRCRATKEGEVLDIFVHIGEEAPINPSLVVNMKGCGLQCRFCQQGASLALTDATGPILTSSLWGHMEHTETRSLSFAGGNPDESLPAILRFLRDAPRDWDLPLVWNTHAYSSPETLALLHGVVDVFLPDFKYGRAECGARWSAIPDYPDVALASVRAMLAQGAFVIVRILVFPGHNDCCHFPVLEALSRISNVSRLVVSIRGQYCPDWGITEADGDLARRPRSYEVEAVRARGRSLGLNLVEDCQKSGEIQSLRQPTEPTQSGPLVSGGDS